MSMDTNTTRRSLLRLGTGALAYGAGAAAVAGGVAFAGEAKGATLQRISPALARLLDQYARADTALCEWYDDVWNPAAKAHRAAHDAVPHTEIPVQGYRNVLDEQTPPHTYSTARKSDVARCKGIMSIPADRQSTDSRWQDTRRAARQLTIAAKWRERKLARLQRQWNVHGYEAREARFWSPIHAATDAILAFPVASALDLGAKLDHMETVGTFESYPDKYQQVVRDDVRRLSSGEA
jgi:hypothetical protein